MSKLDLKDGADVTMYLKEVCSVQEPLLEGHGCKDMSKTWSIFGFHRKYFVLYQGVLVYYDHQSGYNHDKKKGLRNGKCILLEGLFLTKPEPSEAPSTGYSFYLHTPHSLNKKHKMLLVFHSRRDRSRWCDSLQTQNPALLSPPFQLSKKPEQLHHKDKKSSCNTYTIQT